ncbi:hypothetical protein JQK15_14335 [Sphingobium sp. BHU LFT2]|uniref:hypothetical protein n=1 Tax=Sphingobium sp. BHU LFT2 TaxID=2807634 RepID=UPI001BE6CD42|nr:hypothetical protein [Sphingobium sp. BHU LFT2]MBT2244720.1 hypothetical protein [Sphingobium sp. BHU LFT2]
MVTVLYDLSQLLVQGKALLRDDGSMVIWSKMDAAVSVLFALIDEGVSDRGQLLQMASRVPQVHELVALNMLNLLCGDNPELHLWRYDAANGYTLWSRG